MTDSQTYDEEAAFDSAWAKYYNEFGPTTDREGLAWSTAWRAAREYFTRDTDKGEAEMLHEIDRLREIASDSNEEEAPPCRICISANRLSHWRCRTRLGRRLPRSSPRQKRSCRSSRRSPIRTRRRADTLDRDKCSL